MAVPKLSVVFPAYNELPNLPALLLEVERSIPERAVPFEAVIVDDGSTDGTEAFLMAAAAEHPWLRWVRHPVNRGYGAAVRSGILATRGELVFYADADLQFHLAELERFIDAMDGCDAVLGYRAKRADPFVRRLNAFLWNRLVSLLFGLRVKDIDCAFKLFRGEIREVAGHVVSDGAVFSTELLIRLQRGGWSWKELPVRHMPRVAGEQTGAKLSVILKAFYELFRLRRVLREEI